MSEDRRIPLSDLAVYGLQKVVEANQSSFDTRTYNALFLTQDDREAVDAYIVETAHPLATQPSTFEHRLVTLVEEART